MVFLIKKKYYVFKNGLLILLKSIQIRKIELSKFEESCIHLIYERVKLKTFKMYLQNIYYNSKKKKKLRNFRVAGPEENYKLSYKEGSYWGTAGL